MKCAINMQVLIMCSIFLLILLQMQSVSLALINPLVVFFMKYEFWFNYIREVKNKNIPFFVISANFRKNQHFFKWYGGWFRKQLMGITHIFVQNKESTAIAEQRRY